MKNLIVLFSVICLFIACSPSTLDKVPVMGDEVKKATLLTDSEVNNSNNLESYLNRTAGVTVRGVGQNAMASVRNSSDQPIFIVNGSEIGKSYIDAAEYVRNMDIQSVKVLSQLEAEAAYGFRGDDGAVIIRTD